ncbi:MAG: hypothetical protein ABSG68_11655 [Thermoguttaceae bacterium]|jgi:hypothetical protein
MTKKTASALAFVVVPLVLLSSTGCGKIMLGPNLGILGYPVPLTPYLQKREEDAFWKHTRYKRMPILGPITPGAPEVALDPPSDDEVMRKLEEARPVQGGIPFLHEVQRNNVRIVVEPMSDHLDPPRDYPLVGPAQLHHCHYKCTIYYMETTRVGWPVPYTTTDEDCQEVIYIDHDHLHMVGKVDPGPGSNY